MAPGNSKADRHLAGLLRESRRIGGRKRRRRLGPHIAAELAALEQAARDALASREPSRVAVATSAFERAYEDHLRPLRKSTLRTYLETIGWACALALLFRAFGCEAYRIPSASMLPTLHPGDVVLVSKSAYGLRLPGSDRYLRQPATPRRGDVIVFESPDDPTRTLVKRVAGLPGDTIALAGEQLLLNGEPTERRQAIERFEYWNYRADLGYWHPQSGQVWTEQLDGRPHATLHARFLPRPTESVGPFLVPEGHLFLLGDNRDQSDDSRAGWYLPLEKVRGRVSRVWFSWGPGESAEEGIRWQRLLLPLDRLPP